MTSKLQKPLCSKEGCSNFGTLKCGRCFVPSYCSADCQKIDWKTHKKYCKKLESQRGELKLENIPGFNELWAESCKNIDAGRYNVCIPQSKEILQLALDAGIHQENPQLSRIYHRLGHVYMGSGDYNSAEVYFKMAVNIAPENDIEAVRGLIVFYLNKYKCDDAEPLCIRYLKQSESLYGRNDYRCAQPLRFYGLLRQRQKRYEEAIQLLEEAYSAWTRQYGPVHPDVLRVTNDLVEALQDSNQSERAEAFAEQNYENAVTFSPEPNHLTISDSAWSYARVLIQNNSHLERAESILLKALTIRESVLGAEATRVAEILCSIVTLHIKLNKCTSIDKINIERACFNFTKAWGSEHPDAINARRILNDLNNWFETSSSSSCNSIHLKS